LLEIDDEKKLRIFYDKRMSQEVEADALGDEFKGYIFKITGGNDKQGFPMKQGVLSNGRVRLLLSDGHSCFRIRRDGHRERKSVRGCIVGPDLSVIQLVVVKKGDAELPGLTDKYIPRRLGPIRATKIRKLFNLTKEDDVTKYAIAREITKEKDGKTTKKTIKPKIQRLVTPKRLEHKRYKKALQARRKEKSAEEAKEYRKLLHVRAAQRNARQSVVSARRSSQKGSTTEAAKPAAKPTDKKVAKPAAGKVAKPAAADKKGAKAPAKPAAKDAAKKAAAPPAKPAAKEAGKKAPAAKPAAKKAPAKK